MMAPDTTVFGADRVASQMMCAFPLPVSCVPLFVVCLLLCKRRSRPWSGVRGVCPGGETHLLCREGIQHSEGRRVPHCIKRNFPTNKSVSGTYLYQVHRAKYIGHINCLAVGVGGRAQLLIGLWWSKPTRCYFPVDA